MTRYYSETQIRKMIEAPAKFFDLEKFFKKYLDTEFEDFSELEIDENKKLVQLTDEQVMKFDIAIDAYHQEYLETEICAELLGLLGIDYTGEDYWN